MVQESKREIIKDKVVLLVKEFLTNEGGITHYDLEALFGPVSPANMNEVASGSEKEATRRLNISEWDLRIL